MKSIRFGVCVFVCMSFSVHMFSGSSECVQLVHFRNCKFFDGTTFRLIFCCFVSFNLQAIGEPKQIHELCPWPLFLHYHATWQTYFPFFFRSFSLSLAISHLHFVHPFRSTAIFNNQKFSVRTRKTRHKMLFGECWKHSGASFDAIVEFFHLDDWMWLVATLPQTNYTKRTQNYTHGKSERSSK